MDYVTLIVITVHWFCTIVFLIGVCRIAKWLGRRIATGAAMITGRTRMRHAISHGNSTTFIPSIPHTTTSHSTNTAPHQRRAGGDEINPDVLRSRVLKAVFPEQKIENNATLVYDPESNIYKWTNNEPNDECCAICLENLEPGDVFMSGICGHFYHYDCIMIWLKVKDDCPCCRQGMWDQETYQLLEQEIVSLEQ